MQRKEEVRDNIWNPYHHNLFSSKTQGLHLKIPKPLCSGYTFLQHSTTDIAMLAVLPLYPVWTFLIDKTVCDVLETLLHLPEIRIRYFCVLHHGFLYHIQQL